MNEQVNRFQVQLDHHLKRKRQELTLKLDKLDGQRRHPELDSRIQELNRIQSQLHQLDQRIQGSTRDGNE